MVREAFEATHVAEDFQAETYLMSLRQAQIDLARTPAPTIAAAAFKALLIEAEEIWNGIKADLADECMQIVADDFACLLGEV